MFTLNKNYIDNNFRLPETDTLVIFNGIYQPQLSDVTAISILKKQTLKIPKNVTLKKPLHLLFLTSQNHQYSLDIIVEKNSYTTIIEEYASLGDNTYFSNIKTNITAKPYSEIVHYRMQAEDIAYSNRLTKTYINQEKNSKITSNFISKGAKSSTETLEVNLKGENANYSIKGINLLHADQKLSHQIRIEHLAPNCSSNVLFKGVINDHAYNNFDCHVVAHQGATKTETHVTNKNLLLSETASVKTAPELEVYVDDVICTHGATVGQIDPAALFYLRSRGIVKNVAIKLLTEAFIQEIADQFLNYSRFKITMDSNHE